MKTLEIELPDALAATLQEMVEAGWFTSEDEIGRSALADFVARHRFELQEQSKPEDIARPLAQKGETSDVVYRPIGVIHSPFDDPADMPIQPSGRASAPGMAVIRPELTPGLADLTGFSHVILLYHLHCASRVDLSVVPFLDARPRGIFATRAPTRPNPIGLSIVELRRIEGNTLHLDHVDILDNTPLLDIKPYVTEFDRPTATRAGWLEEHYGRVESVKSDDRFR